MCAIGKTTGMFSGNQVLAWKVFRKGRVKRTLRPQYKMEPATVPGIVYTAKIHGHGRDSVPTRRNASGFYAFTTRAAARREVRSYGEGGSLVVRKVILSGVIMKHQTGYRGQFLEIIGKA